MADVDASITISIKDNNLKVTADFSPHEGSGRSLTVEDVLSRLSEIGVRNGILYENIRTMCASTRPLKDMVIAEAVVPGMGENARIESYVTVNKRAKVREREDGSVDYHDLGEIVSVYKGQKLYRRLPPTLGKPGCDVMGNKISGLPGKDIRVVLGNGTAFDELDTDLVIASIDGELILRSGVLHVSELHEVHDDVDFSTGNIKYKGSIRISGTVRAGFTVEAGGNIQVNGNIEDATVIGGNDVTVMGGFAGTGQGIVKAGRDVFIKFVENQRVEAGRDIILTGVSYHAQLRAGRSIVARGGKGTIVGGQAEAKYSVEASRFGSTACVPTLIKMGINPALAERLKGIDEEIARTNETFDKFEQSIVFLYKMKIDNGQLPQDKAALLDKLEAAKKGIPEKLERLNSEKRKLLRDQKDVVKAFVSADIAVYPKVRIYVGNQFLSVEDTLGPSIFKMFEGEVIWLAKTGG
jgi:hypothetical protein